MNSFDVVIISLHQTLIRPSLYLAAISNMFPICVKALTFIIFSSRHVSSLKTDTVQSDTDWDQDFIGPILHSVTSNRLARLLLLQCL